MPNPVSEVTPLSLEKITEEEIPSPDTGAQKEIQDYEAARQAALLQELTQNIQERKDYAWRIYCLLVSWLTVVGSMLFFQAFRFKEFELSDAVLITAISTTTASVVGIFLIVTNYLFPKH